MNKSKKKLTRVTIMIEEEVLKKARIIQAKTIVKGESMSLSKTINDILKKTMK